MIRKIATIVTRTIAERRAAPRKSIRVPVKIMFEPPQNGPKQESAWANLSITGVTRDISSCGIGVIVSSIRVKENYLVGQDRLLRVELQLPERTITMKVIGRRYEEIGIHMSTERFLVGAEIVEMSDDDQAAYDHLISNSKKYAKYAAEMEFRLD